VNDLTVQIVAPIGRDAELLSTFLESEGIRTRVLSGSSIRLSEEERDRAGALLVAEEALNPRLIATLGKLLSKQPAWSDLPFLLLATSGRETVVNLRNRAHRLPLGHQTILERPLRPSSLVSAVQAALRARRRQYEVRDAARNLNEAYAALRMSEQRNRLILESTHDCIKLLDLEGNILSMNEEGQRRFCIPDFSKIYGTPWLSFWKGADLEAAKAAIAAALAGRFGNFEGFYELPATEATWWNVSLTPVRDDAGKMVHLLAVSREITHRKRTEQALIQSEKLAAVGRLASTISHEINNPLEAVTNLIYIALNDKRLPPDIEAMLAAADEELRRASQIVGQTLRFHRQSTHPKHTTPEELVASVLALYRGKLSNSQITTRIEHSSDVSLVCFEGEIRQVLSNLVGNAIDAMRGGGMLIIRTRRTSDRRTARKGVSFFIADNGHGMEPAVMQRIFEPFFSTKGDYGTGLGLWITKGIVEKHRGQITVRSRKGPNGGTVFRLFLPSKIAA